MASLVLNKHLITTLHYKSFAKTILLLYCVDQARSQPIADIPHRKANTKFLGKRRFAASQATNIISVDGQSTAIPKMVTNGIPFPYFTGTNYCTAGKVHLILIYLYFTDLMKSQLISETCEYIATHRSKAYCWFISVSHPSFSNTKIESLNLI
jgi:hypothetical protein